MHLDLMSRLRESLKICKPCRGKTWHQMAPGLSLGQWRAVETDFYAMTLTQDPAIGMTAGWAEGSPSPILGIWQSTYDTPCVGSSFAKRGLYSIRNIPACLAVEVLTPGPSGSGGLQIIMGVQRGEIGLGDAVNKKGP